MYIVIWCGTLVRYDSYKEAINIAKELTTNDENKKALIIRDCFFTEVEEIRHSYGSTWSTTKIDY